MRKRYEWKIAGGTLILGERTLVMGVLNVTPDSFSDGGLYDDPDRAYARALELEDQGVDLIDIGAESTRPGSQRISEAEELRRLIPVLKRLKGKLRVPVSVDTYKAAVAAKALEHGAQIINDPSGLTWEPELASVVADAGAGLVLNHTRGTPETWAKLPPLKDPVETIGSELEASLHRAVQSRVPQESIVVDPGIGFGKRKEQNAEILANLRLLDRLGVPVLVGPSRKSFLAQESEEATEFATAAAVAASILNGAWMVRVHNAGAMAPVVRIADQILAARYEPREIEKRFAHPPREAGPRREAGQRPELESDRPRVEVVRQFSAGLSPEELQKFAEARRKAESAPQRGAKFPLKKAGPLPKWELPAGSDEAPHGEAAPGENSSAREAPPPQASAGDARGDRFPKPRSPRDFREERPDQRRGGDKPLRFQKARQGRKDDRGDRFPKREDFESARRFPKRRFGDEEAGGEFRTRKGQDQGEAGAPPPAGTAPFGTKRFGKAPFGKSPFRTAKPDSAAGHRPGGLSGPGKPFKPKPGGSGKRGPQRPPRGRGPRP